MTALSADPKTNGSGTPDGDTASSLPLLSIDALTLAEQQSDAPKACKTHNRINDTADHRALPTEQPGNQIKLENANKPPVDRANDGEDQCDSIHKLQPPLRLLRMHRIPNHQENIHRKYRRVTV
jgi:hypothetical protein